MKLRLVIIVGAILGAVSGLAQTNVRVTGSITVRPGGIQPLDYSMIQRLAGPPVESPLDFAKRVLDLQQMQAQVESQRLMIEQQKRDLATPRNAPVLPSAAPVAAPQPAPASGNLVITLSGEELGDALTAKDLGGLCTSTIDPAATACFAYIKAVVSIGVMAKSVCAPQTTTMGAFRDAFLRKTPGEFFEQPAYLVVMAAAINTFPCQQNQERK